MNSLTMNLHLMMVSFYRPTPGRYKILIEDPCFPSDLYAVQSQLRMHGYNPQAALLVAHPRPGEHLIRIEELEDLLAREGKQIVLVLFAGVNFVTGQALDIERITKAAHAQGCIAGFDLAHAAGNLPLRLHDWDVDFAVWCNYKYLNSGPGAVGGCFVHERHGASADLPRLAGWWGNDPATRFRMHLNEDFIPKDGAEGWQVSNPPIFSLAPVKASYDIFNEVGVEALREKSLQLTGYLEFLLHRTRTPRLEIITPRDPAQRGCQLSLLIRDDARGLLNKLHAQGVVCDFREPNILRMAPVPLYNTFHEVWSAARTLDRCYQR
jgi:kynureninase